MQVYRLNLCFFDGGAGGAGGAGAAGSAGEGSAGGMAAAAGDGAAADGMAEAGNSAAPVARQANTAPDAGKAGDAAQADTTMADERRAAYDKFKGEYKDLYQADMQKQLASRFRQQRQLEAKMQRMDPALQAIANKYGVDPGDPEAVIRAIERTPSQDEREAGERGLTVEQYKEARRLQDDINRQRQQEQDARKAVARKQVIARWNEQAAQTRQLYPDFDLQAELNAPETGQRFYTLLTRGQLDPQNAFEIVHPERRNALIYNAVGMVAQHTQRQTLDTIKAKGMRPRENGANGNAPAISKQDVTKLTREQREKLAARARRGEAIRFQ